MRIEEDNILCSCCYCLWPFLLLIGLTPSLLLDTPHLGSRSQYCPDSPGNFCNTGFSSPSCSTDEGTPPGSHLIPCFPWAPPSLFTDIFYFSVFMSDLPPPELQISISSDPVAIATWFPIHLKHGEFKTKAIPLPLNKFFFLTSSFLLVILPNAQAL